MGYFKRLEDQLKAALIVSIQVISHTLIYLVLTKDQNILCNVKTVSCSEEPADIYHTTLQFQPVKSRFLVSFSMSFWFTTIALIKLFPASDGNTNESSDQSLPCLHQRKDRLLVISWLTLWSIQWPSSQIFSLNGEQNGAKGNVNV